MKKICLFLFITCIVSANTMVASPVIDTPDSPTQVSLNVVQYDLEILVDMLENLGFVIEKIEVKEPETKDCEMTVKGTIDGKEVDLTIVIKDQTCAEFFKELMSK